MSEVRPAAWKYKHPHGEIMFSQSGAVAKLSGFDAQPLYSEANLAQAVADERERCKDKVWAAIGKHLEKEVGFVKLFLQQVRREMIEAMTESGNKGE